MYICRTSKRIRHQPECTWNQTMTDPCAPVSEAGNSGDEPGGCRTCSGMAGRSNGGTNSADPVFHPSNDKGAQVYGTSGWEKRSANPGIRRIRNGSTAATECLPMRPFPSTTRHGDPLPSSGADDVLHSSFAPCRRGPRTSCGREGSRAASHPPRAGLHLPRPKTLRRPGTERGPRHPAALPGTVNDSKAPSAVLAEGGPDCSTRTVRIPNFCDASTAIGQGTSSSAVSPCRTTRRPGRPMTWTC